MSLRVCEALGFSARSASLYTDRTILFPGFTTRDYHVMHGLLSTIYHNYQLSTVSAAAGAASNQAPKTWIKNPISTGVNFVHSSEVLTVCATLLCPQPFGNHLNTSRSLQITKFTRANNHANWYVHKCCTSKFLMISNIHLTLDGWGYDRHVSDNRERFGWLV